MTTEDPRPYDHLIEVAPLTPAQEALVQTLRENHPSTTVYRVAKAELLAADLKHCWPCNRTLVASVSFAIVRSNADGIDSWCRSCRTAAAVARDKENKEARNRRTHKNNRKARAKLRAAGICYFAGCGQPFEPNRVRCAAHASQHREYLTNLYAKSPEVRIKSAVRAAARRAVKLKAIPLWAYNGDSLEDRRALRTVHHAAIDGGSYAYVKYVIPLYIELMEDFERDKKSIEQMLGVPMAGDHWHPLSKGGEDCSLRNLRIMPTSTNSSKGSKVPYEDWQPPTPVFEQVTVRTHRQGIRP